MKRKRGKGGERGGEGGILKSFSFSLQSSDDEIEEFEVEILKRAGGSLGITIAGLVKTDTGGMLV